MSRTIRLGNRDFAVAPLPLGKLKKLLPTFNRVGVAFAGGIIDEEALDGVLECLSIGLGIPAAELYEIPATMDELTAALEAIAEVAGLKAKEDAPGNSTATETTGTPSTPG